MTFHQCEFYDTCSSSHFVWTSYMNGFSPLWFLLWYLIHDFVKSSRHNQDRRMAFHQCEFYDTCSSSHFVWTSCHNQDIWTASPHCDFYYEYLIHDFVKFLVTIRTDEWLFTSVNSMIPVQVATLFERLVTIRTYERLLPTVISTMNI